jgi:tetratricopeptide (TPR) repeat protein
MLRDTSVAVMLAVVLWAAPARGQTPAAKQPVLEESPARLKGPSQLLSSPSAAGRLWDVAYDLAHSKTITGSEVDQAIVLLTAAKSLSSNVNPIEPLLIELAGKQTEKDYSIQVVSWLQSYVSQSCDRVVVREAVKKLLDRSNSWEDRKRLLEDLVSKIGNKNPAIDSDLAMLLGFLMGEKADLNRAKFYLVQAYKCNKYNKVAFAKLAEIAPDEIGPGIVLEHLRLILRENPLDINAALNFAQYAERLQLFDTASLTYQYCAELFRYLYPTEPLPAHIYLPWAICSYNTLRGQPVSMQIAESVRNTGRFDILLEAIAGRAAAKTGNPQESRRIFQQAEQKAQQLLQAGPQQTAAAQQGDVEATKMSMPRQFAWFYCFADPNAKKALDWANKAYSVEPNAPSVGALLAYALTLNNQMEWAKPLMKSAEGSQIMDLVRAKFLLVEGKKDEAVKTLRMAITKDASSLVAERGREMLKELQSEYTPPIDTNLLMKFLTESFGTNVIPQFLPPDKMVQVQFAIRGNEFAYGSGIEGMVTIQNQGQEPLIITEDGLFKGSIRIDAKVSGDLKGQIAPLVVQTVRTELMVQPGRSFVVPVKLLTGELRELLQAHPQASLEIQFTLYIDPVAAENGSVNNRLLDLKPVTVTVKRPHIDLTASYVRNRFNAISSGQQGQRIGTAELFAGLLKEQSTMLGGTLYAYRYADWMPGLLRSAFTSDSGLLLGSDEDNWVVAIHAMADMTSMPLDGELTAALAKNLHHSAWPVRMMALYVLANGTGGNFQKVIDWFAQNDPSEHVRDMAAALRSGPPLMPVPAGSP